MDTQQQFCTFPCLRWARQRRYIAASSIVFVATCYEGCVAEWVRKELVAFFCFCAVCAPASLIALLTLFSPDSEVA
ncbi:hypothetical protein QBC40DRAFT_274900 [Triangularia verruculosa]|uniref:Uncharacterized protein n=1 Tax=Triangularia verruculosa TaxID=2587418 RepID=A0AAN6XMT9_9PEZI|nr:hypothetical protein QBC40DRAFT_274900 [Triangularia verruculosa]